MASIIANSLTTNSISQSNAIQQVNNYSGLFNCSCQIQSQLSQSVNLETQYYEQFSSAQYEQNINSQQVILKNAATPALNNSNNTHTHNIAAQDTICIVHSHNPEIIAKMDKQLMLNEQYKQLFHAQSKVRASKNEKPLCGSSLKDVISYHCFDCFEDRKAIICESCFDHSDHFGHRYYSQKQCSGLCDCGDPEIVYPQAKVGCSQHKGKIQNDIDLKQLDEQFITRAQKLLPEWFKIIFESVELYLIKMDPQISEFQNKIMNCAFKVIQSLQVKDDIVLSKAISDILIKPGNNYYLYHDCDDVSNKIPCDHLTKKECTCSILELIFRFVMYPCFTYDTQNIIRQNLIDLMNVQTFKIGYAKAFIKMFKFLFEIDYTTTPQKYQTYSNCLICMTQSEVFNSYVLNQAVYESGHVRQIFLNFLSIAKFLNEKKHEGDQKSKIIIYQYFYYHFRNISNLITKELLFERFLQEPELFDILLLTQQQLQCIIDFNHKIYMPEQNIIEKNTYLLYYRVTGQLNLFKIIANNLSLKINQKHYHDILIQQINKTLNSIENQNQNKGSINSERISTYFPLERAFIYLFFAYFQFELSNVNQESLQTLTQQLGYTPEEMKNKLINILKIAIQSISIYQEVHNKMWVFNGDDFESHIRQYTHSDFEIKVVDTMFIKIVAKLYPLEDILQYMPQNPFTSSLVSLKQEELLKEYSTKEVKIYENAQNMVLKSFASLSSFLNFICYNTCSELDEIYFKCIQNCQTMTEVGEDIIAQSATYFATLINGLSNTVKDTKSLGELYQQDLGKKAPVLEMCQKVSKAEANSAVVIKKEYENIYEPFNFIFNFDAQSKYYGAIEVNQNIQTKVQMILGNVPLKNQNYIQIGSNTINYSLLKYMQDFLNLPYNLNTISENLHLKESILYSVLKLIIIFMQVQKYDQLNNILLDSLIQQLQTIMHEPQFQPLIQYVVQIKLSYAPKNNNTQNDQSSQMEIESTQKVEEQPKNNDLEQRRKAQLLRQQEILKQMQSKQNKVKEMYLNNAQNTQQVDEECCFCKQPLSQSAYGVLVSIQKNTFYSDQELKSLHNNITNSKNSQLSNERLEEVKQVYYLEQRDHPDMFVFNTCDHKVHKECYESNVSKAQPIQNQMPNQNSHEQRAREIEIQCQICKQYKNFFLEINNNEGFEEEKYENKKLSKNNNQFGQDTDPNSLFNTDFGMGFSNIFNNSYENQGFQDTFNDFTGGYQMDNFGLPEFSFDTQPKMKNNQDEEDDGEVKEIIYKKVKKNNSEAQFKESQTNSLQRMGKIYNNFRNDKQKLNQIRDYFRQSTNNLSKQAQQDQQDEQKLMLMRRQLQDISQATSIFDKHVAANDLKNICVEYQFENIISNPSEQFQFYERCFYNQIRYYDLANKRPDDDTAILKVASFLFQSCLNSFAYISNQETRFNFIKMRFQFCQYFEELIQNGSIHKFDENLIKNLPYVLKKEYLENNLTDAYTLYLIFKLSFQFTSSTHTDCDEILQKTLPLVMKKFALQIISSQSYLLKSMNKCSIENEDDVEDLQCFLLRLARRAIIISILYKKYALKNTTFDKVFSSSSKFDNENTIILKHFGLSINDCLPTQNEIDNLENNLSFQKLSTQKPFKSSILPLLLISTAESFCFDLIHIPNDYLEYSMTIHKKKCSLCNKMPLISDLMQCLICGDLMCAQSCTQSINHTQGSLHRHSNIYHGGHAIFINTQSGYVTVISSPHSTILISTFIFQNSLKQNFRKMIKCDWRSYHLVKNIVQNLKKQLYENNTRNLIMEDQQQRTERNMLPIIQYGL